MPYELLIGLRYTRSRKNASHEAFVSVISKLSMMGITLGVAALIVVLSVMNGLQDEIRARILSVASHVEINAFPELIGWELTEETVRQNTHVTGAAPFVLGQGMVSHDGVSQGSMLRGIDPAREEGVSDISTHIKQGSFEALTPGSFGIVLGTRQARNLGEEVGMGSEVTVIVPQGLLTGAVPRLRSFKVVGIFGTDLYEIDSGFAFINIEDAKQLFQMEGVTGLRLKLDDLFLAPIVSEEIAAQLPSLAVRNWTDSHANLFSAMQLEKRMMFIILTLVVFVAAFNIISAQVMVVTEKQPDIAILRTLGASPSSILGIFIFQGMLVGVLGTIIGVAGGIALALNVDTVVPAIEQLFGVGITVNFISKGDLPSVLIAGDVIMVAATALFFALVATIYPARKAARVNPAAALRYE